MREMIVDIDNSESVVSLIDKVFENWCDPKKIYSDLKTNGKTNSPNFWAITNRLLADVAEYLNQSSEKFLDTWNQKCITLNVRIMGYHCTRHSNKQVFTKNGILPFSDKTIKILNDKNPSIGVWSCRLKTSPGPYFFLSYKSARSPNNHFCNSGPEILQSCDGYHIGSDPAKSIPLVIHCAIPYSILPDKDYYASCILIAYFNLIDPEDDSDNLFEGWSIDLKGNSLDPQYIVRIEEVGTII